MPGSGGLRAVESSLDDVARRRAEWLLLGRFVLTAVGFAIAVGLELPGSELTEARRIGLFWTVALAFGATAISATMVRRLRHLHRFAAFQIALDVGIVTSLVHFSGAWESLFAFLYVLVTLYGALLFHRWGALGAATLSAVCYAGVLWVAKSSTEAGDAVTWGQVGAVWALHVGAFYLVGILASVLSSELRRTGQALDQRTGALIRLRNLHERTVESLMSGLLTTDPRGAITYFNPEAEQITGLGAPDVLGRGVDEIIPGAGELVFGTDAGDSEPQRQRLPFRNRAGRERHVGLAASILWDEDGREAGHVLIFQDVTEVVAMERQLRQSERLAAVGEMAANMAHEIRNPLAAISGSVQVLRAGASPNEGGSERERLMQIVVREADRLSGLIQDFLHFARPRPPSCQPVLLGSIVEEVAKLLSSSLEPNVVLEVDPGPATLALVDPQQIRQVVWNLCLNGAQAMPEGGRLRISVREALPQAPVSSRRKADGGGGLETTAESRWVELEVTDEGAGIPLEVQEHIFDPFFTTKKEGSGLGLSTVHRIVESHGGALQVESEEGSGTTFRVRLPRAKEGS